MGLMLEPGAAHCGKAALIANAAPTSTAQRLAGSQVAQGQRGIAWAWLGSPTERYQHAAMGSRTHAGSLHVLTATVPGAATSALQEIIYRQPTYRVFEDLTLRGSSVVVFGLEDLPNGKALQEKAISAPAYSTFRWHNPVGVADLDGDGKQDVAAVITLHAGGVLTLYHYRPPQLVPYARAMDIPNHLIGSPEQQLAVIL